MARPQAPPVEVRRWRAGAWATEQDAVAAEEPLQVLVGGVDWAVVMRTPGDDVELALGLLHGERVIGSLADVTRVNLSAEAADAGPALVSRELLESNAIDIHLRDGAVALPARTFTASSACGICGQTTLEDLAELFEPVVSDAVFDASRLPGLPDRLRAAQGVFDRTGGLHAAGLFTAEGGLLVAREDIGRHNAVDKVVGWALLEGRLPLSDCALAVSGRVGYEVAQKAVAAGIPLLAAVGAPSSLAVQVGQRFGLAIAGFVRDGRFNVYSAPERLA